MESELQLREKFVKDWNGKADGRISCSIAPHSIYLVFRRASAADPSVQKNTSLRLSHPFSETRKEVSIAWHAHKKRPAYYLDSLGVLSGRMVGQRTASGSPTRKCGCSPQRKVSASLNPVSNMKLAGGGLRQCRDAEVRHERFPGHGRLGVQQLPFHARNHEILRAPAEELALGCNSCEGLPQYSGLQRLADARALGINAGEIKEGKLADLVLLDQKAPNMAPRHSLVSNLVYSAHAGNVTDTIIDGKLVMENRKVLTMDEEKVVESAQKEAGKLSSCD